MGGIDRVCQRQEGGGIILEKLVVKIDKISSIQKGGIDILVNVPITKGQMVCGWYCGG